jgi:hypothetical protein
MDINYLGVLVLPAMAGFFWFGKRDEEADLQEVRERHEASSASTGDESGVSGVERYLNNPANFTTVSSVDKYLLKRDRFPATGVTKYLRRVAVAEKQSAPKQTATSVEKYLKSQKDVPPITGVARYLKKHERPPASGVAKYVARQAVAAKQVEVQVVTGVAKYMENQDRLAVSAVDKYLAKQAVAARQAEALRQSAEAKCVDLESETGVGRYLRYRGL